MKKVKIRHIAKLDRETVNNLLQNLINFTRIIVIDDEMMEMLYRRRDTFAEVITIEENGREKVVGFGMINFFPVAAAGGLVGKIEDVIIDPNYRCHGLATKLCKCLIEIAKSRNAKEIKLHCNRKRIAARKLYEKLGFEKRETDVFELKL